MIPLASLKVQCRVLRVCPHDLQPRKHISIRISRGVLQHLQQAVIKRLNDYRSKRTIQVRPLAIPTHHPQQKQHDQSRFPNPRRFPDKQFVQLIILQVLQRLTVGHQQLSPGSPELFIGPSIELQCQHEAIKIVMRRRNQHLLVQQHHVTHQ